MSSLQHRILKMGLNLSSTLFPTKDINLTLLRETTELISFVALLPWGVKSTKFKIGELEAEVIKPVHTSEKKRALLYLHGGGFAIGSNQTHRHMVGKIVKDTATEALLINYRKIPNHPCPAPIEDAYEGYQFLLKEGYQEEEIIVAGDSAGGGLVCTLFFMLKEKGDQLPKAGICLSPWLDLMHTGETVEDNKYTDPFVKIDEMKRWAEVYAGTKPLDDPYVSPLYGDFTDFPPILIQTSKNEVLHDDSVRLKKALEDKGIKVTYQEWDDLIHWWQLFWRFIPESDEALTKVSSYIHQQFK
ncbi:alpha/beta hydrolase [Flammeovirga sp. EKP202]|uniref:alpha/beta hydrolase n=1 Tax=Flammeovirga sp. EKP202 TaxID=2770592 RepID=UPI00165F0463|nr:alpha/beta hydrolase [Flammeovirga sp. EKP202]MBD0403081.1 alpha/beta hydrolase [Flammeovirga sp. EKP202]